jgi:glycosyltransferase involved in cell wall biosynthesis
VVLHNPVHAPPVVPNAAARECAILTLGVLGERKGTYDILRAVPLVLDQCPGAEFWLGGDGDVEGVRAAIAAAPWGTRVRLPGWVEGAEKAGYLARAGVFLLPSYAEGLPVAVLEAMAHGLAVITTPVGGIPDAVVDGETGIMVPPGDVPAIARACVSLLRDADLRARLGACARRRVEDRFEVSRVLGELYATYDGLLARAAPAASPKARS